MLDGSMRDGLPARGAPRLCTFTGPRGGACSCKATETGLCTRHQHMKEASERDGADATGSELPRASVPAPAVNTPFLQELSLTVGATAVQWGAASLAEAFARVAASGPRDHDVYRECALAERIKTPLRLVGFADRLGGNSWG